MAEFCTNCAAKYNQPLDIDVKKLYKKLKAGNEIETDTICEGCGLIGIRNDGTGKIQTAHYLRNKIVWKTYTIAEPENKQPPEWLTEW